MDEAIKEEQWVYVHNQFRGKVVRIRHIFDVTYYDVEIEGVITDYTIDQVTPIKE